MMDKAAADLLITEAAKYGLAVLILTILNVAFASFIFIMWKQQMKERKDLVEVIKDNTAAFTSLQGTINTLIQVFSKTR